MMCIIGITRRLRLRYSRLWIQVEISLEITFCNVVMSRWRSRCTASATLHWKRGFRSCPRRFMSWTPIRDVHPTTFLIRWGWKSDSIAGGHKSRVTSTSSHGWHPTCHSRGWHLFGQRIRWGRIGRCTSGRASTHGVPIIRGRIFTQRWPQGGARGQR